MAMDYGAEGKPILRVAEVGILHGANPASVTSFGEPYAIPITPVVQHDAIYGIDPDKIFTRFTGTAYASNNNSTYRLSTGLDQDSIALAQTKRVIRYRPGQGALARFTAGFVNPAAGYSIRAGFANLENAIQIGYDGDRFGIVRYSGGKSEVYQLNITNPAGGGGSTVTITLDGTAYVLSVPSDTTSGNAAYIAEQNFGDWNVEEYSTFVRFQRDVVGPAAGVFSVTATGQFAATFTQLQAGVNHSEYWVYREDFNLDTLDGNGVSKIDLDLTKLNVWQIQMRWLGVGAIRFSVEHPNTGDLVAFHHIHYAGKFEVPHVLNPSMKIQYIAESTGGENNNAEIYGSSMMGAIEGVISSVSLPNAVGNDVPSIGQGTYQHMLSLRNNKIYLTQINTREILLKSISAAANATANAPIRVFIYKGIQTADNREFQRIGDYSFASFSTQDTTITHAIDRIIYQFVIIPGSAINVDLSPLRIALEPGLTIAVGITGTNNIQNASVSLTWVED